LSIKGGPGPGRKKEGKRERKKERGTEGKKEH
jgi:hypothetical protein